MSNNFNDFLKQLEDSVNQQFRDNLNEALQNAEIINPKVTIEKQIEIIKN